VHPYLTQDRLGRRERDSLAWVLQQVPWCWPPNQDPVYTRAELVSGLDSPPKLRPGDAPLLSEAPKATALSLLRLSEIYGEPSGGNRIPLDATKAWRQARAALAPALPLLWKALNPSRRHPHGGISLTPPSALYVVANGFPMILQGDSFGLSFFLAQASALLDVSLPSDLAVSATVSTQGKVGPVEGLERKLGFLLEHAPGLTRLLVANEQGGEANDLAAGRLKVETAGRVDDAIQLAWPRLLDDWKTLSDPALREQRIASLFDLALAGRDSVPTWRPVQHAADVALHWPELDESSRARLEFSRAVAARHERENEPPPNLTHFLALPNPDRANAVAHLVQQSVDTGQPEAERMLEIAEEILSRRQGANAFPGDLRILGAKGRLLSAIGKQEQALRCQIEAAEAWASRPRQCEASFPLSEAYRLSAALDDRQSFDRAHELDRRVARLLPPSDALWVTSARGRALASLASTDDDRANAQADLESIWSREEPFSLRLQAGRSLRQLAASQADLGAVSRLDQAWLNLTTSTSLALETLADDRADHRRDELKGRLRRLRLGRALMDLHEAVRVLSDDELAEQRAGEVEESWPELVALLKGRIPATRGWPTYLLSFFPY
jgi:tetratricopeptide (TPR) repeat protein